MALRRVCVFCGSSLGARPAYAETAAALGAELAARGVGLVYGGAHVGLMGLVADTCRSAGGEVAVKAETTSPSRNTIAPAPPSISIDRYPVFLLNETIWMMSRRGRSSRLP